MRLRERAGGFRQRIRSTRAGRLALRVVVTIVGTLVVAVGIVLIPFPGPGWAIVFAGLAILALEFVWARHLLAFAKKQVGAWWQWLARQHGFVRFLVGFATLLFVTGVVYLSLRLSLGVKTPGELIDYLRGERSGDG